MAASSLSIFCPALSSKLFSSRMIPSIRDDDPDCVLEVDPEPDCVGREDEDVAVVVEEVEAEDDVSSGVAATV